MTTSRGDWQGQGWCGPAVQGVALVQFHAEKSPVFRELRMVDHWTAWTG